jgi:hypothetical protein
MRIFLPELSVKGATAWGLGELRVVQVFLL